MVKSGYRIKLVSMEDFDAIKPGEIGTVVSCVKHDAGINSWLQIDVNWDSGRTLMVVSPPDVFEVIYEKEEHE